MQHFKTPSLSARVKASLMLTFLLTLTIEGCSVDVAPHLGRDAYMMKTVPEGIVIVPMEDLQGTGYCMNSDGSFTEQDFKIQVRREIRVGGEFKFHSNQIKLTKPLVFKALVPGKTETDALVMADTMTLDKGCTIQPGPLWKPPLKNSTISETPPEESK